MELEAQVCIKTQQVDKTTRKCAVEAEWVYSLVRWTISHQRKYRTQKKVFKQAKNPRKTPFRPKGARYVRCPTIEEYAPINEIRKQKPKWSIRYQRPQEQDGKETQHIMPITPALAGIA